MSLSSQNLEALRMQLNLSTRNFCDKIGIEINNYALFMRTDNINLFSANSANKLYSLMLEEEFKNLVEYKDKFPREADGYFASGKILRHLDKLVLLGTDPTHVGPITVEFHPSNVCNLFCPFCTFGIPMIENDKKKNFNMELLPKLIADMKQLDVRGIDIAGGGEPLCHPDIWEIISSFAQSFDVGLVTNGYSLSDDCDSESRKKLREVILSNCTWCRISVDAGSQEAYSLMHGEKTHIKFDDIVNKIGLIAEDKMRMNSKTTLGISFLVTPDNFLDLIGSICIFREIKGIDYFQVKPIVIAPAERIQKGIIFWDKRLFELLTTINLSSRSIFLLQS